MAKPNTRLRNVASHGAMRRTYSRSTWGRQTGTSRWGTRRALSILMTQIFASGAGWPNYRIRPGTEARMRDQVPARCPGNPCGENLLSESRLASPFDWTAPVSPMRLTPRRIELDVIFYGPAFFRREKWSRPVTRGRVYRQTLRVRSSSIGRSEQTSAGRIPVRR